MMQDMNEQTSLQMNEEKIEFISNGLLLRGIVRLPSGLRDGEKRPAVIVLHGFGSNKSAENVLGPCGVLGSLGYITLRFDMSGCGESAGPRGNLICLEQVQNTRDAVTFLSAHPFVEEGRIALIGSSFGAAIGIYTGAVDERVAAVISSGGWGHGERKFRGQHPTPESYARFCAMLEQGRLHRENLNIFNGTTHGNCADSCWFKEANCIWFHSGIYCRNCSEYV